MLKSEAVDTKIYIGTPSLQGLIYLFIYQNLSYQLSNNKRSVTLDIFTASLVRLANLLTFLQIEWDINQSLHANMRIVPVGPTGKIGSSLRFVKKKRRFNQSQATKRASLAKISLRYLYNNKNSGGFLTISARLSYFINYLEPHWFGSFGNNGSSLLLLQLLYHNKG